MKINFALYEELLKAEKEDLQTQINFAQNLINEYKYWHLGSKKQQITRKKSFDKNTEKLIVLKDKLNIIKTELSELEASKCV